MVVLICVLCAYLTRSNDILQGTHSLSPSSYTGRAIGILGWKTMKFGWKQQTFKVGDSTVLKMPRDAISQCKKG